MNSWISSLALTAFVIVLGMSGAARAGQFEDGLAAYNRQDFKTVVSLWHSAAENGDVNAQYHLGSMYFDGRGVKTDYIEAMKWLHMSADRGHAGAQNRLGLMYENGLGVAPDDIEADMWFTLAAAGSNKFFAKDRDALRAHMTAAQIAEGSRRARKWHVGRSLGPSANTSDGQHEK